MQVAAEAAATGASHPGGGRWEVGRGTGRPLRAAASVGPAARDGARALQWTLPPPGRAMAVAGWRVGRGAGAQKPVPQKAESECQGGGEVAAKGAATSASAPPLPEAGGTVGAVGAVPTRQGVVDGTGIRAEERRTTPKG